MNRKQLEKLKALTDGALKYIEKTSQEKKKDGNKNEKTISRS